MMDIAICEIPAGNYLIGDDLLSPSRPEHTVHLAAFAIGRTAVTNAQFSVFVADQGYARQDLWGEMGWRWLESKEVTRPAYFGDDLFNAPQQPVVGVCWYEASAFARWLGVISGLPWRLPSEAEWEAAARGPEDETPTPRQYNTAERSLGRPWPVTTPGNSSWCGAADLCGNVWEWTGSRWGRNWQTLEYFYPYNAFDGREDPAGSHARVMRGGSWFDPLREAQPANRGRYLPGSRGSNIGFRVARSLNRDHS